MEIPHTTTEQRAPLYAGVSELIYPGYLTTPVWFGGTLVVLRSLGPADYLALQYLESDRMDWILTRSILRVGGRFYQGEPELFDYVRELDSSVRKRLYASFLQLQHLVNQAADRVVSYCYESDSRWRWQASGRKLLDPQVASGSPLQLGHNVVQQMWLAFNLLEDQRHADMRYWQGCKLIAATQSPKGIAQLNKLDEQAFRDEEERRQFVMDQMYYRAFDIKIEQEDFTIHGLRYDSVTGMYRVRTVEDMEEQLRREIAGEEDWHDRAVREWREETLARQAQERADRLKRATEVLGPDSPLASSEGRHRRTEEDLPISYDVLKPAPAMPLQVQNGRVVAQEGYRILGDSTILTPPVGEVPIEHRRVRISEDGVLGG